MNRGLREAGLGWAEGLPDLPGHDELRHPGRTGLASRRGRGRADREGGGGRRHHVLRHGRHLLGWRQRADHRAPARQVLRPPRGLRAGDPLSDERYDAGADFDVVDRLAEVAAERGAPPAPVALAWLLSRPGVTAPIVGATRPGHIGDALAAAELTLTAGAAARLEEPCVPHP